MTMDRNRRVSSIGDLPPKILDTCVDHLPRQVLDNLGMQLFNDGRGVVGNWEGVAEELGISTTRELEEIRRLALVQRMFPGRLMLRDWSKKSGSTVFVLLNALRNQGREDCIDMVIKACQDAHSMQLLVKIEDESGQHRYLSVDTKKDATLGASLENVLTGLPSYKITGPNSKITWQTPAYHLKGTQLSLKKGEATEDSRRIVYDFVPVSISAQHAPQTQAHHYSDSVNPYSGQITVPLNIPVTEPPSTSLNAVSTTVPKIPQPLPSMPATYNDLSKQEHYNEFPTKEVESLSSHPNFFPSNFPSQGPPQFLRQTLLKQSCSVDETASFMDNTSMKRCDPVRHSDRPVRHVPKVMDYIPHADPRINFSNLSSSPSQCGRPMPRAKNEDYVSPDSLQGPSGIPCKPPPCVKYSIHVGPDQMSPPNSLPPKPKPKPKPMPCVLQQRKDGYIDIVTQGKDNKTDPHDAQSMPVLRQQSVQEHSAMNVDNTEGQERERPRSLPEDVANAVAVPCLLSRDDNGYATFASQNSLMDVDRDEGSDSNVKFTCPVYIETDQDGYLSYSGASDSTVTSMEGSIDSNISGDTQTSQTTPLVIQSGSNGYFGFAGTSASDSPPQQPVPCTDSGYIAMSRSESMPAPIACEGNDNDLIYAKFNLEDEEEDADYFDMKKLPLHQTVQAASINRHWSEGDIEYLDILPTSSEYDYIESTHQSPNQRALPPRPNQPAPMKRRRFRSQDPENKVSADGKVPCDPDTVPGWCPHETEESICSTMKRYQQEDGNFIVWWMERKKRYVVTVSHINELRHYAIYERQQGSSVRLFIFGGAEDFANLKELVEHYMKEGMKGPDVPAGQSRGKRWQTFSHVRLRKPLKVKYTRSIVRKKAS